MSDDIAIFPDQRTSEHVVTWVHKHWIVYARTSAIIVLAGVVFPVILAYVAEFLFSGTSIIGAAYLGILMLILYVWLWSFVRFVDDEFDCLIVTNERVIDINQDGLFSIASASSSLEHIDSTTGRTTGLLGNILNYGTVTAETSAKHIVAELMNVDDPENIAAILRETAEEYHRTHTTGGRPIDGGNYDEASYAEEIEHA